MLRDPGTPGCPRVGLMHGRLKAAEKAAVMIVIGGRNSGNTRRLYEICKARCEATHHIESDVEIDPSWLDGVERIGITAGASTPQEHIDAVRDRVRELAGGVA